MTNPTETALASRVAGMRPEDRQVTLEDDLRAPPGRGRESIQPPPNPAREGNTRSVTHGAYLEAAHWPRGCRDRPGPAPARPGVDDQRIPGGRPVRGGN